ncbi:MAG: UDP-N-acetylmuramoyl-L-alanine--D-glutamate ligase, partial [Actinobacteria bacterium]|nr:UDP-N-acetylmuramoyl-L-alanine--D-glutamate ligase [Actinomycetota bacterium]
MRSALVVGMGVTGEAVARHLRARDVRVTVVEDNPGAGTDERMARLPEGVELVRAPDADALRALVVAADLVVPSPGVPNAHPVYELAAAADVPVVNEIELAARATTVPIVAVTGTNGKTTVTTLITDMLEAAGRRAVAAGNIGLPLVEAVESDAEVIVAEVSSFQ